MNNRPHGNPFIILLTAVIILGALSVMRWDRMTFGKLKNFDLLADIVPGHSVIPFDETTPIDAYIDPDLLALMSDSLQASPSAPVSTRPTPNSPTNPNTTASTDTASQNKRQPSDTPSPDKTPVLPAVKAPEVLRRADGVTPIEDYSPNHDALGRFREALQHADSRNVRVAVIGDSYIEGDIFTEAVRYSLQDRYGGSGVGYSPLFSEIPGFRRSVIMNCSGWKLLDWRNADGRAYAWLPGFVSVTDGEKSSTTFSGSKKIPHAASWDNSTLLFIAPNGATVNVRADDGEWVQHSLDRDPERVQAISLQGPTSRLSISSSSPGLIALGAFMDGDHGVSVDNMSIRGYSGIRHNELNAGVVERMQAAGIDYDLIILEFGINALSPAQTNYDAYGHKMIQVINRIRQLYPRADILLMGIGDRGQKAGGEIHSMTTIPNMIATQRSVAKATGVAFWDTQAAMGGRDAVVEWSDKKQINKDYIHLSFPGGKRLAGEFVNALSDAVR